VRVVSLLPAATEIVAALGAQSMLVGISHECDYPPSVLRLPRVTATPIDIEAPGATIDAEVRRLHLAGQPVIAVDESALRQLAPISSSPRISVRSVPSTTGRFTGSRAAFSDNPRWCRSAHIIWQECGRTSALSELRWT